MAKTHPHAESPSEDTLRELVQERPEEIRAMYLSAHSLVLEAVPEIQYSVDCTDLSVGYGAHQFGYNGWGMAAVTPFTKWVTITFLAGADLEDPQGILEGSAAAMRHVKLKSFDQFEQNRGAIKGLIEQAARIRYQM